MKRREKKVSSLTLVLILSRIIENWNEEKKRRGEKKKSY